MNEALKYTEPCSTLNSFDRDYFENGVATGKSLYVNYQWLPDLTIPMCAKLKAELGIGDGDSLLDFGCAKGYVVKAMRMLGVDAWGYDVSEYAVSCAPSDVAPYVSTDYPKWGFSWALAKDVLEHVPYTDVVGTVRALNCQRLFVAVPLGENGRYRVPAYELDQTHMIREPLEWWESVVRQAGFAVNWSGHTFPGMKQNYRAFPRGNGYIIGGR